MQRGLESGHQKLVYIASANNKSAFDHLSLEVVSDALMHWRFYPRLVPTLRGNQQIGMCS